MIANHICTETSEREDNPTTKTRDRSINQSIDRWGSVETMERWNNLQAQPMNREQPDYNHPMRKNGYSLAQILEVLLPSSPALPRTTTSLNGNLSPPPPLDGQSVPAIANGKGSEPDGVETYTRISFSSLPTPCRALLLLCFPYQLLLLNTEVPLTRPSRTTT